MQSKKFKLNKDDGLKIAKGAGIATLGSLLTFLVLVLGEIDFGEYTPIVLLSQPLLSTAVNTLIKYLQGK